MKTDHWFYGLFQGAPDLIAALLPSVGGELAELPKAFWIGAGKKESRKVKHKPKLVAAGGVRRDSTPERAADVLEQQQQMQGIRGRSLPLRNQVLVEAAGLL